MNPIKIFIVKETDGHILLFSTDDDDASMAGLYGKSSKYPEGCINCKSLKHHLENIYGDLLSVGKNY